MKARIQRLTVPVFKHHLLVRSNPWVMGNILMTHRACLSMPCPVSAAEESCDLDIGFRLETSIRAGSQSLIVRFQSDYRRNDSRTGTGVVP